MIQSIDIQGYRGFSHFEMSELGVINLLVGGNNSGKTSVLEAIYLLTSRGDPESIWRLLWRRGEQLPNDRQRDLEPEIDICHLFTGHDLHVGSRITLSARNQSPKRVIEFEIAEPTQKDRDSIRLQAPPNRFPLVMHVTGTQVPTTIIPITRKGGISSETFEMPRRIRGRVNDDSERAQFITTESLNANELVKMWDKVALTPNEALVMKAIQFLDPNIERIASQSTSDYYSVPTRGGFKIKLKGHEQPVPIGSMGDGMWRMLALAIAISNSKGGVLLVDEIDTGLHYTVMSQMWSLLYESAKALNVQIFATTHSSDCVDSLAKICVGDLDPQYRVTLQRIEAGKKKSVPYSEGEIKMASARKIEVR
ncbi:MAG: ATP-binding protein [Methylacidiphilales bacterium]|nr:ATP-binding protein [Candidatus Methylacidiphilales bacterium]